MKVSWFSAGVSSFIATYLERDSIDKIIYTHIDDQHPDTLRFLHDCEKALGKEIEILESPYKSVGNVLRTFNTNNTPYGARCTEVLKKRVRKEWEYGRKDLVYIWGYDVGEKHRAERINESMPQFKHIFPLIERELTKEDCHGMLRQLGIKRPAMYDMGYRNNNCIGCIKGGMGYWNKIRVDFPEVFKDRARQERECGHSNIKGIYLDELDPTAGRIEDEVMEECSIICQIAGGQL
jgi:3'-phosphoadenosine 5'-phosphosulfate sulfotransferase (PAPS reductase)/FAD synthetase